MVDVRPAIEHVVGAQHQLEDDHDHGHGHGDDHDHHNGEDCYDDDCSG